MRLLREYIRNLLSEANGNATPDFDGFMTEYRSMSQRNPLNPSIQYWYMGKVDDEDCLVLTDINVFDGAISFNTIQTVPPDKCERKGFASKVMNQIVALADKHRVPMSLDPIPFGQESVGEEDLGSWYTRVGFSPDDEYGGEWRRQPK